MNEDCVFCEILEQDSKKQIIAKNMHAIAIRDGFPLSNGHTLLIPKRHTQSFFDLTENERTAILAQSTSPKLRLS